MSDSSSSRSIEDIIAALMNPCESGVCSCCHKALPYDEHNPWIYDIYEEGSSLYVTHNLREDQQVCPDCMGTCEECGDIGCLKKLKLCMRCLKKNCIQCGVQCIPTFSYTCKNGDCDAHLCEGCTTTNKACPCETCPDSTPSVRCCECKCFHCIKALEIVRMHGPDKAVCKDCLVDPALGYTCQLCGERTSNDSFCTACGVKCGVFYCAP